MVGVLQPLPQTRLWDRLEKENRIFRASKGENKGEVHYEPKMGSEALESGYRDLLSKIYTPAKYYQRLNIFLKSYKPTAKGSVNAQDLKALYISFWRIGVLSRARFYYWYMLFKTLITKHKSFPMYVELAIHGEHFRKSALEFLKKSEKKPLQEV